MLRLLEAKEGACYRTRDGSACLSWCDVVPRRLSDRNNDSPYKREVCNSYVIPGRRTTPIIPCNIDNCIDNSAQQQGCVKGKGVILRPCGPKNLLPGVPSYTWAIARHPGRG